MPTWDNRLPFLTAAGKTQIRNRYDACRPNVSRELRIPVEALANAKMLGCGNYGCTYLVEGLPPDRNIIKITTDNLEAHVVNMFVSYPNDPTPSGIVHYEGIWLLGKCSVIPKMKPFMHEITEKDPKYSYLTNKRTVFWSGEGAPYRPVWLIQREELPDIGPALKSLGISQKKVKHAILLLDQYARQLFRDNGLMKKIPVHYRVDMAELEQALDEVHGLSLLSAIEWLADRQIAFLDFQKLANLGWREGTGLVIRDIGFSSNETDLDPPAVINGVWGR